MRKYVLFPHGGSGNHGCEAIVRTTVQMLEKREMILYSSGIDEDNKYLGDDIIKIISPTKNIKKTSIDYWQAFMKAHIFEKFDAFDALYYQPIIESCNADTVLVSIGGDNYCYGENEYIYMVNRYARKQGAKTVLWGCSVEPGKISKEMEVDLKGYDLIVARESLTYSALRNINSHTVLYPDPAFTLPVEDGIWPDGFEKKCFVGVNISPMIQQKESVSGITLENYRNLIKNILEKTEDDIVLIPHVVWESNDDRRPLTELYNQFKKSGRVHLVKDQNCLQLKDIISKCKIFIGARTHATIAAYSTCVPTLVVGYSVKAKGIAKDLFGSYEHYVVPVQKLKHENDLWNSYQWIAERDYLIREHLKGIMPQYISRAFEAGKLLIGEKN